MRLLLCTLCWLPISLFAQNLKGKIVDNYQKAITDAHILNLANGHHTHSHENGMFVLQKSSLGDTIEVSHIGYQSKRMVIQSWGDLTISLIKKQISLDEITISSSINPLNVITQIDIQLYPVNSSQEILRQVPGLFIGQHAGGGKAEQIFLRGFDIDHGTDISLTVDDMPINMVSHAHGQGYSDLHFVIPETLHKIDFSKGAYQANKGNYNTAGFANLQTKTHLDASLLKLELGQFNSQRFVGVFNILNQKNHNAYIASEYMSTDGAFESPQNFKRLNLFGKYTGNIHKDDQVGVTFSHFTSKWDASGQVPLRAIKQGMITRFGAVDDTEGGETSRTNVIFSYDKSLDNNLFIKNKFFYSHYDFELYSNFTFFLEDAQNGDQIKQKEHRDIYGLNSELYQHFTFGNIVADWRLGVQLRHDQIEDNELSHTVNRHNTLKRIQFGDITETNIGTYLSANFNINRWTITPSLRFDYFDFQYYNKLQKNYKNQTTTKTIISPKISVLYQISKNIQCYAKAGKGFHSNDARVILEQKKQNILPASYGGDIGISGKLTPRLLFDVAYWYLFLEQEFVYVGDAGVVEPSGKTQRQGVDLSLHYQLHKNVFCHLDMNYAHARSLENESSQNYIPLAPSLTLVNRLTYKTSNFYTSLNTRYISNRPANEDNSIVAKGYTVFDWNVGYQWRRFDFGIQIQNLFNTAWNETQFATESRLKNEPEPVEEIHFTPGTPFFLKSVLTYKF